MKTISPPPMLMLATPIVERPATTKDDGMSRDPYSPWRVTHWGSHPNDLDDCFQGENFKYEMNALRAFHTETTNYHVQYIMLDGPGLYQVRKNKFFDAARIARERDHHLGFAAWFNQEPIDPNPEYEEVI